MKVEMKEKQNHNEQNENVQIKNEESCNNKLRNNENSQENINIQSNDKFQNNEEFQNNSINGTSIKGAAIYGSTMGLDSDQLQNIERINKIAEGARWFRLLGIPSILYGLIFVLCLYENICGIMVPVWTLATILYVVYLLASMEIAWKKTSLLYVAALEGLGISTCLTTSWIIIFFNYVMFFGLLILFLLHQTKHTMTWNFTNVLLEGCRAVFGAVSKLFAPAAEAVACFTQYRERHSKEDGEGTEHHKTRNSVMIGLVIAVPFLLILGACLISADAVFSNMISSISFSFSIPDHVVAIVFLFLFGSISSYCGMRYCLERRDVAQYHEITKKDAVVAITFTSAILLLYLWFCGIQVVYLFGGYGTLPEGMTYATYARTGFFQLLFVCILNLVLVLFVKKIFAENKLLNGILIAICGCSYIMTASSMYRMLLYIQAYHLTFLRVLVVYALVVIGILLAGVIAAVCKASFPIFNFGMIVVVSAYLIFSFAHVDYFIADYDLKVYAENKDLEVANYVSGLSMDAAPAIADYVRSDEKMLAQIQRGIESAGGDLGNMDYEPVYGNANWYMRYLYYSQSDLQKTGIRRWNLSRYMAGKCLPGYSSNTL